MALTSLRAAARVGRAALLAGVFALGGWGAAPAAAHAIVVESVPAADAVLDTAPDRVTLRFNSKIERRLSRVTLGPVGSLPSPVAIVEGDESPDRIVVSLPPIGPGRYVLRYKVLSADGHVTEGALRFTVAAGRP